MNTNCDFQFKFTSHDGQFSYTILPIVRQNAALKLITRAFYPFECVCNALGVSDNPKAVDELNELVKETVKDGVTIIATDNTTNEIVGISVNKIQIDSSMDLFQHFTTEKLLRIIFLAVLPEYNGRGIGYELVKVDLQLLAELNKSFRGPDLAIAIWSSNLSAKIGERLGFQVLSEYFYDKMEWNGIKLKDKIDSQHKSTKVTSIKIERESNFHAGSKIWKARQ